MTRLDAILEFKLIYPYNASLQLLEEVCSIWNLGILKSGTSSEVDVQLQSIHQGSEHSTAVEGIQYASEGVWCTYC